jgi:hypothetical protein
MVNDIGYEGGYISKLSIIDGKLMTKTPTEEHLSHLVSTEKQLLLALILEESTPSCSAKIV